MLQPEGRFGLILLPGLSFPAWQALAVAMGVDVAGLLLGWKMFDHGAHLVRAWTPAAPSVWRRRLMRTTHCSKWEAG